MHEIVELSARAQIGTSYTENNRPNCLIIQALRQVRVQADLDRLFLAIRQLDGAAAPGAPVYSLPVILAQSGNFVKGAQILAGYSGPMTECRGPGSGSFMI